VRAANERWMKALQFKLDRPGLRLLPEETPDAPLSSATAEGPSFARSMFQSRRTLRYFDTSNPVTVDRLGRWFECLRETRDGKTYHREYPSAGSLYPVQTYLWVKSGGVSGLANGLYYYDPIRHRLALINRNLMLARELYDPINYSVFDRSAFALFLIGKLSAIAPLYDQAARDFCLIEAGCMTQLLMVEAGAHSIGLCPIGGMAFDRIREGFEIDEQHTLLHSLLGGAAPPSRKRREEKEGAATLPAAPPPTRAPSQETTEDTLIADVLAFSRETLPEYLVPSRFVVVNRLPLSSNGKIDRSQLPDPPPPGEQASAEPPRTDVEKAVAEIWMDLLQAPQVNVGDDFFALGGDSILSIRFLNRVGERFHVELPLREFFGAATLEKVAAMIERIVIARVHGLDEKDVQQILSSAE
jgi:SagB-type dehydrogenase family enzyme